MRSRVIRWSPAAAQVIWDEMSVGAVGPFIAAGFTEVSHPTKRRVVMRLEL